MPEAFTFGSNVREKINYEVDNPQVKSTMRAIGAKIGKALSTCVGWGFMLMLFEFNKEDGSVFYISDCDRADVIDAMQKWAKREGDVPLLPESPDKLPPEGVYEVNPDHKVTKALHEHWNKIAAVLVHKFASTSEIVLTPEDVNAFADAGDATPTIMVDDQKDGLHLRIISRAQAEALAKAEGGRSIDVSLRK